MTWHQAADELVKRTGHERYRWLCSDENPDARQRESYRAMMLEKAGQPVPPHSMTVPTPPLASSLRAVRLGFRQCLYSSHEGCGCTGTHCFAKGRIVGLADCIDCLKGPK